MLDEEIFYSCIVFSKVTLIVFARQLIIETKKNACLEKIALW